MELPSCHHFDAQNLVVAPRLLENLWNPVLDYELNYRILAGRDFSFLQNTRTDVGSNQPLIKWLDQPYFRWQSSGMLSGSFTSIEFQG
jgi:hypothetical protein